MKRYLVIALVILKVGAFGQENLTMFIDSAKTAYTQGDYQSALRLYYRVVEHGYESPQLYYNIANCYYKQMMIAKAILWYQRALKLNPSFEDARYNLSLAQDLIVDRIEPIVPPFYRRWYNSLVVSLAPNSWALLSGSVFIVFIICMFVIFSSLNDRLRQLALIIGFLTLLISATTYFIASSAFDYATKSNLGVIMEPTVVVKSKPHEEGTTLFTLHEGLTVKIETSLDGWYQIRLDDGRVGWIPQNLIEAV